MISSTLLIFKNIRTYLTQLKESHTRSEVLEDFCHFGSISVVYYILLVRMFLYAFKIALYCV